MTVDELIGQASRQLNQIQQLLPVIGQHLAWRFAPEDIHVMIKWAEEHRRVTGMEYPQSPEPVEQFLFGLKVFEDELMLPHYSDTYATAGEDPLCSG